MLTPFIILAASGAYAQVYPSEVAFALDFFRVNDQKFIANTPGLTDSDRLMAKAIVAPEVSTYSAVANFVELRSLFVMYVYQGSGDFSVGIFQMKPSFAEMIEKMAASDTSLAKEYPDWIREFKAGETEKEQRRARLKRLEDDEWQMRYLTLFYRLASKRIAKMAFKSDTARLRYLATLYNSGLTSSPEKVRRMMTRKYFPHSRPDFNYADVAEEFYDLLKK